MSMAGVRSPHQFSEREKGSSNKRKFRADPSPSLSSAPSCSQCSSGSNATKGFAVHSCWKIASNSLEASNIDGLDVRTDENVSSVSNASCYGVCKCTTVSGGLRLDASGYGYNEFTAIRDYLEEDEEMESIEEADWNDVTESQLEELLLSNLDAIYRIAVKRIVASGFTEEVALEAVLRYGRCYGRKDTLTNIVDNTLAKIKGLDDESSKDLCFDDLQQLEKCVLEGMLCFLRDVRPFFSKGNAMWCLLLCDMNLTHAGAMDDDAFNGFKKRSIHTNSSVASYGQFNSETPLSAMPSAASNCISSFKTGAGALPHVTRDPEISVSEMPFIAGAPSFSVGAFSGSMPRGSCKHDNTVRSVVLEGMQSENSSPCIRNADSTNRMQTAPKFSVSHIASPSTFILSVENESVSIPSEPGTMAEECVLSMAQPIQKAENVTYVSRQENAETIASHVKGVSGTLFASSGTMKKPSNSEADDACSSKVSAITKVALSEGIDNKKSVCEENAGSCVTCPSISSLYQNSISCSEDTHNFCQNSKSCSKAIDVSPSAQDDSLAKSSKTEGDPIDHASSFAVASTELSLSLASAVNISGKVNDSTSSVDKTSDFIPDTVSLEQFFVPRDKKGDVLLRMYRRAKELETQIHEWSEWAQEKVMQAARRLSKDKAELKALRQEKDEAMRLKKAKQTLEESTMKRLSDMEISLRKTSCDAESSDANVHRLEIENVQLRQEMESAKLAASKSSAACQEALKREIKTSKRFEDWERQKSMLQDELAAEKRKRYQLENQLEKAKEHRLQLEVRLKQEEKAKEEAITRLAAEKDAKEQFEAVVRHKEEELLRKEEADSNRYREAIHRLEHEIIQLRLETASSKTAAMRWGPSFSVNTPVINAESEFLKQNARLHSENLEGQGLSQKEIRRDRECVMCLSEEMSVVFLPCAHQVVCKNCNDMHAEQGMKDCPSCRTLIQQRIHVNTT